MSESESYTEAAVETVMEEVHAESEQTKSEKELITNRWIALTTIILTLISSLCALGSSMSSHEGSRFRDETTLATAEQSGKRAVVHILNSQKRLFSELNLPFDPELDKTILILEKESAQLSDLATMTKQTAEIEKNTLHLFEFASTFLGVAISFCGLAILLSRKWVWFAGIGIGSIATCFVFAAYFYRLTNF